VTLTLVIQQSKCISLRHSHEQAEGYLRSETIPALRNNTCAQKQYLRSETIPALRNNTCSETIPAIRNNTCAQKQPPSCVLLSAGRLRTQYAAPSHLHCQDSVGGRRRRKKVLAVLGCCTCVCDTCVMELAQKCEYIDVCVQ